MTSPPAAFKFSEDTKPIWNGDWYSSKHEGTSDNKHFWDKGKVRSVVKSESEGGCILKKATSKLDRIKIVRENSTSAKVLGEWRQFVQSDVDLNLSKCPKTSNTLRMEGNEFYKRKDFPMALKGFNLALCFAEGGSSEQVLAYSNRSACFMELGQHAKCILDIDQTLEILDNNAKSNTSLEDRQSLLVLKKKLAERKERCLGKMRIAEEPNSKSLLGIKEIFTLKSPSAVIESAEDFIQIRDDQDGQVGRGRHVVTTKRVEPGTLLILETPFSTALIKQFRWEVDYCHHCLKPIFGKTDSVPVSCPGCIFAIYCSYNCLLLDCPQHTLYECKTSPYLHLLQLNRLVLLSFRTILKAGSKELYKLWKSKASHLPPGVVLGFDPATRMYMSSTYLPIFHLMHHDETMTESELWEYCLDSILLSELLWEKTEFFRPVEVNESQEFKDFVSSLILLHQLNFPCNAHSLNLLQLPSSSPKYPSLKAEDIVAAKCEEFGAGAFSLLSLINHSCDPSVARITLPGQGTNAVVAIKVIQENQELLDNYGVHYALQEWGERRRHLLTYYGFPCGCIPCLEKWPTMEEMTESNGGIRFNCPKCTKKKHPIDPKTGLCPNCTTSYDVQQLENKVQKCAIEKFEKAHDLLLKCQPTQAIPLLCQCISNLKDNHVKEPCLTLNYAQETMKQALNLLAVNYA